jgi:hypothetical protein
MAEMYIPELPDAHAAALRTVRLTIYGGKHGAEKIIEPYGHACVGVIDGDYAGIGIAVDSLDPARGDTLAYESAWIDPEAVDPAWLDERLRSRCLKSSLVQADSTDRYALAEQARAAQIISPQAYAVWRALTKGVRVAYADATAADKAAWLQRRAEQGELFEPGLHESEVFRSARMVERLGVIAAGMDYGNRWRRPHLAMAVGNAHTPCLQTLLRPYRIRPRIRTYSPHLGKRFYEDVTHIRNGNLEAEENSWLARARQIEHSR